MASRTLSLFQVHNGSPAGSSLAPLGSISNPASCDRCVEDPTNETSSELFTFHAYMPVVDDFPKGPSNPGDDVPPADTPTSPTIQAQEDTNVIEGHLADPAEYPAEDTADATDATDADLLQELSNDDPTFTNMEQVGRAEAQASTPAVTMEPAPAPPRFPIQPDAESLQAACHGSTRDACLQGQPGVARPSNTSAKNIGRKECRESRRKHVDRSDGSSREYWRIGRTHQITCRLEISVLITGLDMIG